MAQCKEEGSDFITIRMCVCVCVVIFLLRGALCLYIMQRFVHWQHHMNVKAVICLILIMINRLDYSRAAIDIKKL